MLNFNKGKYKMKTVKEYFNANTTFVMEQLF